MLMQKSRGVVVLLFSRFCRKQLSSSSWLHFPQCLPAWVGHLSPVNSPHKGQWRGALMFSLICVWINSWINNRETGDLKYYRAHYDIIVMIFFRVALQALGRSCNGPNPSEAWDICVKMKVINKTQQSANHIHGSLDGFEFQTLISTKRFGWLSQFCTGLQPPNCDDLQNR